jgi:hypothetical protein
VNTPCSVARTVSCLRARALIELPVADEARCDVRVGGVGEERRVRGDEYAKKEKERLSIKGAARRCKFFASRFARETARERGARGRAGHNAGSIARILR